MTGSPSNGSPAVVRDSHRYAYDGSRDPAEARNPSISVIFGTPTGEEPDPRPFGTSDCSRSVHVYCGTTAASEISLPRGERHDPYGSRSSSRVVISSHACPPP